MLKKGDEVKVIKSCDVFSGKIGIVEEIIADPGVSARYRIRFCDPSDRNACFWFDESELLHVKKSAIVGVNALTAKCEAQQKTIDEQQEKIKALNNDMAEVLKEWKAEKEKNEKLGQDLKRATDQATKYGVMLLELMEAIHDVKNK